MEDTKNHAALFRLLIIFITDEIKILIIINSLLPIINTAKVLAINFQLNSFQPSSKYILNILIMIVRPNIIKVHIPGMINTWMDAYT